MQTHSETHTHGHLQRHRQRHRHVTQTHNTFKRNSRTLRPPPGVRFVWFVGLDMVSSMTEKRTGDWCRVLALGHGPSFAVPNGWALATQQHPHDNTTTLPDHPHAETYGHTDTLRHTDNDTDTSHRHTQSHEHTQSQTHGCTHPRSDSYSFADLATQRNSDTVWFMDLLRQTLSWVGLVGQVRTRVDYAVWNAVPLKVGVAESFCYRRKDRQGQDAAADARPCLDLPDTALSAPAAAKASASSISPHESHEPPWGAVLRPCD